MLVITARQRQPPRRGRRLRGVASGLPLRGRRLRKFASNLHVIVVHGSVLACACGP